MRTEQEIHRVVIANNYHEDNNNRYGIRGDKRAMELHYCRRNPFKQQDYS